MGHKVNPELVRLSISRDWRSRWFAPNKKQYARQLNEDRRIREHMARELSSAAIARIDIERSAEKTRVVIHTARPGMLIGRRGENIQRLQEAIQKIVGLQQQLKIDYVEVANPAINAQLIADSLAFQLEKRIAFRRAMKRVIQQAMESGAKGIRVVCDGRLAGAEMTRREVYRAGTVPLGTFRARVDFGVGTAHTTAGCIGTKVWVCRPEQLIAIERTDAARGHFTSVPAEAPEPQSVSSGAKSS